MKKLDKKVFEEIKAMGSSPIAQKADSREAEPSNVFIWKSTASLKSWLTVRELPGIDFR